MSAPTGSRISRPGDAVNATVIAPVFSEGELLIPQGATVSGTVEEVGRLGYGLKHVTSDMRYRFTTLQLPDGKTVPITATVLQVETARERVNADGLIGGIYPTANLSSTLASYVIPLLCVSPHFGVPFLGIKVIIARSPDPEIYFPTGTELVLRLTAPASVPSPQTEAAAIPRLSPEDIAEVHGLLKRLPQQRTNRGRNHPSDLVNVLFLGNRESINRAFRAAGWFGAQRSSLRTVYGMYHCMVERMGYKTAPMGHLTLNGLRADAEYQKSLDTFSKRHHVRLWQQGEDEAWLSSATEDVGFRVRNMHLTHGADPAIDNERNKVMNDVAFTGCVDSATLVPRAMADAQESSIQTDGRLAVLRLNDCRHPHSIVPQSTAPNARRRPRPVQMLVALRNDLIRNNPVFLMYNTVKLLCEGSGAGGNRSATLFGFKREKSGGSEIQNGWVRPSVLDAEAYAN